jgi:hypothetical protein
MVKANAGNTQNIDDVARETDQDRGKGRAPFPADNLPDGRGGGSARVVPGHSGRDWAVAIGSRVVRMKADHGKTLQNTEEVSSQPAEKGHWSQKWQRNTPTPEKNRGELGKKAYKSGRREDNHENSKKQFIYAMNIKSNGKSRFTGSNIGNFAGQTSGALKANRKRCR